MLALFFSPGAAITRCGLIVEALLSDNFPCFRNAGQEFLQRRLQFRISLLLSRRLTEQRSEARHRFRKTFRKINQKVQRIGMRFPVCAAALNAF